MLSRAFDGVTNVSQAVLPQLLAAVTFAMGCVLLLSGATPGEPARVEWLSRIVPLPAIEISHFLGSLIGVGLLLLSSGIWRRLDMAYYVTIALLAAGIFTTLVKGIDYEEAVLLALALVALIIARGWFDRRTHFFAWRLSPTWLASVLGAVATSLWLGGFAYRHVEYSRELWWQFEFDGDASRFLRASVGVGVALLVFTGRRLLTPAPPEVPLPSDGDLADAERIVSAQPLTNACLVFLRDKALLFDARRTGFIMYGVRGRTWVAMGDPVVADPGPAPELVRRFLERCDDFDGRPVFYEVGKERLHLYADFGLAFVKLGEEARVPLRTFGLEGSERKALRMAHRRVTSDGGTFRIVMPPEVDALLPELEEISVKWLRNKSAAEKGFSLGFFSRDYVRRFPVALIEREGRIEAFANVWTTADKGEVSTDLMRHRESPIRQLMDGLFVHLLLWGQAQGYEYFNLGMAPLSGLGDSPANTLWNRIASIVFEHGGRFYNFQGLRVYKQKFHPVWEPRYLVYSGRLTLAPILADVAALVAGGYRRMLFR
jgi:phosphatidylglycerol lysyltransferase